LYTSLFPSLLLLLTANACVAGMAQQSTTSVEDVGDASPDGFKFFQVGEALLFNNMIGAIAHLVLQPIVIYTRAQMRCVAAVLRGRRGGGAQCYVQKDRHETLRLIRRAEAVGVKVQVNSRTHVPIKLMRGFRDPMYH
jgi:hypothetical protein